MSVTVAIAMSVFACVAPAAHADLLTPELFGAAEGQTVFDTPPDLSTAAVQAEQQAALEQQRQDSLLATPEADTQRAESLTAFQDLTGTEALNVAQQAFSDVMDHPLWQPAQLTPDEHIVSYPSDFSARIGSSSHPGYAILDSTVPLRDRDTNGDKMPVSVRLEDAGNAYVPENPLAETRIAKDLWSGVSFEGAGFSVRPAVVPGLTAPTVADGKVYFANVDTDTDFMVGPTPTGAETFFVLRSPESPAEPGLVFNLLEGQVLRLREDGSGAAEVVSASTVVAVIPPPVATDALGAPVPSRYAVEGNTLSIEVDTVGSQTAYPVLVDPVIDDESGNYSWANQGWAGNAGWSYYTPWSCCFSSSFGSGSYGRGEYQSASLPNTCCYGANTYGMWRYKAPGASFVYRAEFQGQTASQNGTCSTSGIVTTDASDVPQTWQQYGTNCNASISNVYSTWCVTADCSPSSVTTNGNEAAFMLSTPGGIISGTNYLAGAKVFLHDLNNPWGDFGLPGGWFDNTVTHQVGQHFTDAGLGVLGASIGIKPAGSSASDPYWTWGSLSTPAPAGSLKTDCDGTAVARCPAAWDPSAGTFPDVLSDLDEGSYTADVNVVDAAGNLNTSNTRSIGVDTVAPELVPSGDLWDGREQFLDKNQPYTLRLLADDRLYDADGNVDPTAVSGLSNVTVKVDNVVVNPTRAVDGSCSGGSRYCIADYDINPYNYAPGHHQVDITAADSLNTGTPHAATPVSFGFNSVIGTLNSPTSGTVTGRRVMLQTTLRKGAPSGTTVKFQFGPNATNCSAPTWTDISLSSGVVRDSRGNVLSSWPALRSDGSTPPLVWDISKTANLASDQKICVRALFSGTQSGPSQLAIVPFDRGSPGSDRATEAVGPGSVDLLTGNFSYAATDVDIDSPVANLTVSRSFNSRAPGSTTADANSPLGPGWKLNVPVPEAASDYQKLDASTLVFDGSNNKGFVTLSLTDGSQVAFRRDLASYVPDAGFERLALSHKPSSATSLTAITEFDLTDEAGNTIVFKRPTGSGTEFRPTAVMQAAGSTSQTTYAFGVVGSTSRPLRALAPVPKDLANASPTCTSVAQTGNGALAPGCRMLEFLYAGDAKATNCGSTGSYTNRLREIDLLAAEGGSDTVVKRTAVACYSYDSNGRLSEAWDPRISTVLSDCTDSSGAATGCAPLKETYSYDSGGRLATIAPPGLNSWSMTYTSVSPDPSGGRLASVNRATPTEDGSVKTATTTVVYNVALSGTGAPYQMDAATLDAIGQRDIPFDATAIFPPDQVPPATPTSWSRATIHYLDAAGREVNTVEPGGHISTSEYDSHGNVVRELTAANRACALSSACASWAGSTSAAKAAALDTHRTFAANNVDLKEEWGPLHKIARPDGSTPYARRHVVNTYNDNGGGPDPSFDYHLVTQTDVTALVGSSDVDRRTTVYGYDGTSSDGVARVGWKLRKPTSVYVDYGGLGLRTVSVYDSVTGAVTESRMPRNPNGGDASSIQTLFYVKGTSTDSDCGSKAGWDGMVCKTKPAAQPGTAGLPDLPVSVFEYDQLGQAAKQTDTSGSDTRTATRTYDAAGRAASEAITATAGEPLPAVASSYDAATGLPTKTIADGRTIRREYDALGRPTAYTDADGQRSTTTYDLLSRPVVTDDGKGRQTRTYDTSIDARGLLTKVDDSQAGVFDARYDEDGHLVSDAYPGGLTATTTYDPSGDATDLVYAKAGSTWLHDSQASSIHGQWLAHDASGQITEHQDYAYDGAGRLTLAKDTRAGKCTTRTYEYAGAGGSAALSDSNRTKLTVRPSPDSSCDTSSAGTVTSYSYDAADREADPGFAYDAFGRTTQVPADYAGGKALGTAASPLTYYANDLAASVTQDGVTVSYALDPAGRVRQRTTSGSSSASELDHYSDDSDSPSWTLDDAASGAYTRSVEGPAGDLVALVGSGTPTLELTNLHGDVVGTAASSASALTPAAAADEFGVPLAAAAPRFGWLGSKERRTELGSGVIAMGVRVYVPQMGRFAQTDPVAGGSANDYDYADQDPVNAFDLNGLCTWWHPNCMVRRGKKFVGHIHFHPKGDAIACGGSLVVAGGLTLLTGVGSLTYAGAAVICGAAAGGNEACNQRGHLGAVVHNVCKLLPYKYLRYVGVGTSGGHGHVA